MIGGLSVWIAPAVSALLVGVPTMVTQVKGQGKREAWEAGMNDRVERIEKHLGIENGNPPTFVRRTECPMLDGSMRTTMDDLRERMLSLEEAVRGRRA